MNWESSLESAIEVAIGIAGFSGIVSAVGRRGAGHWTEVDQFRLRVLLTASGSALVFSFLPFMLIDLIDPTPTWRLVSGLQAIYFLAISSYRVREASASGIARAVGVRPIRLMIQAGIGILLAANAFLFASPSIYVFGVMWSLVFAFMAFVRLLLDTWQDPIEPEPPAV